MPYDTRMAITDALRKKTHPVSDFSVLNFEPDPEKVLYTVMLSSTELSVTGISNESHAKHTLSGLCSLALLLPPDSRRRREPAPDSGYRATSGSCRGYRR